MQEDRLASSAPSPRGIRGPLGQFSSTELLGDPTETLRRPLPLPLLDGSYVEVPKHW